MKPLLSTLVGTALLIPTAFSLAATAQSFYPHLYAVRFCELRAMGVDGPRARRIAISENWAPTRAAIPLKEGGDPDLTIDVYEAVQTITRRCPQYIDD